MRLKLAYALLCEPRVIVLSPLFDVVGHRWREHIFESLRKDESLTLVYFSYRRDLECFDQFLFFEPTAQRYVAGIEALQKAEADSWAIAENLSHQQER